MLVHSLSLKPDHKNQIVRLLQLTDSHLLENPNKTFAGVVPYKSLQAVIQHVTEKQKFDVVVSTGDIAQEGTPSTYQQYFESVDQLNTPHFYIRGNHDGTSHFPSQQDKNDFEIILIENWCIILLNSQVDAHIYGDLTQSQLEELNLLLEKYKTYHVLLALHHHTFAVGCAWLDQHILKNADEFLACITPHLNVKAVICGHVHQDSSFTHQHIKFLSSPSTFVQFKPQSDEFRLDTLPPGYRMLYLHPDGYVESEVYYLTENVGNIDHNLSEY